jgi:hypothetical protein
MAFGDKSKESNSNAKDKRKIVLPSPVIDEKAEPKEKSQQSASQSNSNKSKDKGSDTKSNSNKSKDKKVDTKSNSNKSKDKKTNNIGEVLNNWVSENVTEEVNQDLSDCIHKIIYSIFASPYKILLPIIYDWKYGKSKTMYLVASAVVSVVALIINYFIWVLVPSYNPVPWFISIGIVTLLMFILTSSINPVDKIKSVRVTVRGNTSKSTSEENNSLNPISDDEEEFDADEEEFEDYEEDFDSNEDDLMDIEIPDTTSNPSLINNPENNINVDNIENTDTINDVDVIDIIDDADDLLEDIELIIEDEEDLIDDSSDISITINEETQKELRDLFSGSLFTNNKSELNQDSNTLVKEFGRELDSLDKSSNSSKNSYEEVDGVFNKDSQCEYYGDIAKNVDLKGLSKMFSNNKGE